MILIVYLAIENNIVYFAIYFGCSKIVIVFWAVENNIVYLRTILVVPVIVIVFGLLRITLFEVLFWLGLWF